VAFIGKTDLMGDKPVQRGGTMVRLEDGIEQRHRKESLQWWFGLR